MLLRNYETLYILSPKCPDNDVNKICKAFEDIISKTGGELVKTERWGKKRLAYEVKKNREGFYVMLQFKGTNKLVRELERNMRITEDVIRFLTVRIDDKIKIESVVGASAITRGTSMDETTSEGDDYSPDRHRRRFEEQPGESGFRRRGDDAEDERG